MLAIICLISLTGLTTVVNNATDRLERRVRVVSAAHDPAQRDAVGRANGRNCLALIVPCHRVIRADGNLCGYGGGVWRKQWVLEHERRVITQAA